MFYREKKVDCGRYREVDIIPRTDILGFDNVHSMLWIAASKGPTSDLPGYHISVPMKGLHVLAW